MTRMKIAARKNVTSRVVMVCNEVNVKCFCFNKGRAHQTAIGMHNISSILRMASPASAISCTTIVIFFQTSVINGNTIRVAIVDPTAYHSSELELLPSAWYHVYHSQTVPQKQTPTMEATIASITTRVAHHSRTNIPNDPNSAITQRANSSNQKLPTSCQSSSR